MGYLQDVLRSFACARSIPAPIGKYPRPRRERNLLTAFALVSSFAGLRQSRSVSTVGGVLVRYRNVSLLTHQRQNVHCRRRVLNSSSLLGLDVIGQANPMLGQNF